MRIALVTQDDPFYLPPAVEQFCRTREVAAVILLRAFDEGRGATAKRLWNFYGPWDFVRLLVRFVGAKTADALNRSIRLTRRPYSCVDVARRLALPLHRPADVNAPEFLEVLRSEIRPDLIVSIASSQPFSRELLTLPLHGCINLYSAPLPRYQGMMPNFWVMADGHPEATVTVHVMAEKLEDCDAIVRRRFPIHPTDSLHTVMVRSKQIGVEALLEAASLIENNRARRERLDMTQATTVSFPTRADAARLRRRGHALL